MSADAGFVQPAVKMHLNARIPGPTCRPFVLDGSAQRLRTCGDQLSGCPHFSAPKATMMLLELRGAARESWVRNGCALPGGQKSLHNESGPSPLKGAQRLRTGAHKPIP